MCNEIIETNNEYQNFSINLYIVRNITGPPKEMKTKLTCLDFPRAIPFPLCYSSLAQAKRHMGQQLGV